MELKRVDHVGIAVKNLDESVQFYESLGFKATGYEVVAEQKVKVAFLPCGDSELELLESTEPDGPIARFIEKNGPGIKALEELKEKGVRLIDQTPRYGAGNARIAFVHPKATGGVLLELTQRM